MIYFLAFIWKMRGVSVLTLSPGMYTPVSYTHLAELVRRPELGYFMLTEIDEKRPKLSYDTAEQVNINIKYEGYLKRQQQQVAQFKKLEKKKLDPDFDYSSVNSLRREAVQKLNLYKPVSIGQASRISGVSPADISVPVSYTHLAVYKRQQISDVKKEVPQHEDDFPAEEQTEIKSSWLQS